MSDPPRASFFEELKRRKVVRVALVYGAVAFALAQVADILFPRLLLPDWTVTLVLVLALFGFPVAMVLAWAFELTPDGNVKRTARTDSDAAAPGTAPHRWTSRRTVIAAGLALALGVAVGVLARAPAEGGRDLRSIAVLPFDDFTGTPESQLFADGIHEDVITQLSKIADLKVISRSSVLSYAEGRPNVRQIGRELGVATILEGSVRRENDRIRVTVQLIDAETDAHVWAENYDETLTGILDLQQRVATRIAVTLQASLTPAEAAALADGGTTEPRAHEHWLLGQALFEQARDRGDPGRVLMDRAEDEFRAALALDPRFARAQASLAAAMLWGRPGQSEGDYRARGDTVEALLRSAEALSPQDPWVRFRRGFHLVYNPWGQDLEGGLSDYLAALEGLPGSAELHYEMSWTLAALGRWTEAWNYGQRAAELDPRSPRVLAEVAGMAKWVREYARANDLLTRAAGLGPAGSLARGIHFQLFELELLRGRLDEGMLAHFDAWVAVEARTPAQLDAFVQNRRYEMHRRASITGAPSSSRPSSAPSGRRPGTPGSSRTDRW